LLINFYRLHEQISHLITREDYGALFEEGGYECARCRQLLCAAGDAN
jgi:hypothetical protein